MNGSAVRHAPRRLLRHKLLLIVMVASSAALLLSAAALLLYELQSYRKAVVDDLRTQAELMAQSIAPTLQFDDRKAASSALAALRLRPQVQAAAVYTGGGALFATYEAPGAEPAPAWPATTAGDTLQMGGTQILLSHRIVADGETLGVMVMRAQHEIAARVGSYLLILLGTTAAGLGVAWLIYRRLHPSITGPLLAVAAAAQRVTGERDYDVRVQARSDDEVGTLVDAFNGMLDRLSVEMAERRHAESALRDADRRKDEFLATLAHELRNPLAPLRNGLEILRRADDDPAARQRVQRVMERQLTHMVRLIDDLLDVSRITRGRLELRLETLDCCAVARQAVDAVQSDAEARRHALHTQWPDSPLWVRADAARLTQVLVNLLTNAVKYTPPGGEIRLALQRRGERICIEVADDGIGIAPEHQRAVFEMFVQVDRSLERGMTGLGIGLTIVRQLVELHGGHVEVHSEGPGRGSAFVVDLPMVGAPTAVADLGVPLPAAPGPALDVLIADDNVDFAESFAVLLAQEGHRTRVVHDGPSALAAASELAPDVLFLDIGLPGLNGYRVAQQLREQPATRAVLVIAVTGWAQQTDRRRSSEAGFDHHWVKPVDSEQALQFLRVQAHRRRAGPLQEAAAG